MVPGTAAGPGFSLLDVLQYLDFVVAYFGIQGSVQGLGRFRGARNQS